MQYDNIVKVEYNSQIVTIVLKRDLLILSEY
jgi:hypothetical protein